MISLVPGGRNRDRMVEPCPVGEPFFSFGETWRGEYEIKQRGWYVVTKTKALTGPYPTKAVAVWSTKNARVS